MEKEKEIDKKIEDDAEFEERMKAEKKEKQEKLEELTREKKEKYQNAKNKEQEIEQEIETMLNENPDEQIPIEKYSDLYKANTEFQIALREYMLALEKSNSKPPIYHQGATEMMDKALKRNKELFDE